MTARRSKTPDRAITGYFAGAPSRIYRQKDLGQILDAHREKWKLSQTLSLAKFIAHLLETTELRRVHLALPHRPETRYVWGDVPAIVLAASIKAESYLTHFSALSVHELTEQVPKTIYVNVEQRPQVSHPESLSQEAIDRAFRNQQRMTTNVADYEGYRLVYLNGKFTGQLGVVDQRLATGETVRVTDLERTLIDIAVRPAYSGGVARVAAAYRSAIARVSVNRMAALLTKMEFVYPYEQVVGFYLERAGVEPSLLRLLRRKPVRFDFYLAHGLKETEYVKDWRLRIPKGF